LDIARGDFLLQINGKKIRDVLDYRFVVQSEELTIEILKPTNEIWELEIEKDADEDLGIIFEQPLLSAKRKCCNKCIFCFIDQQPRGLRPSLYVKDDDVRLSFLHGNYVTLTNLSRAEITRIAQFHLSPLRISVHAADVELRKKMMGCAKAENLFNSLEILANAGISMHFQVVLCKEINDGEHLDYTIRKLSAQKGAESLAIVPAGRTAFASEKIKPFTAHDAEKIITQIEEHRAVFRKKLKKNFVFAADEWYIMANNPLPNFSQYEDFPQLDNGVGLIKFFEESFLRAAKESGDEKILHVSNNGGSENFFRAANKNNDENFFHTSKQLADKNYLHISNNSTRENCLHISNNSTKENSLHVSNKTVEENCLHASNNISRNVDLTHRDNSSKEGENANARVGIITGFAAEKFMHELTKNFENVSVFPIKNNFFGESITVSGLLVGADIIEQMCACNDENSHAKKIIADEISRAKKIIDDEISHAKKNDADEISHAKKNHGCDIFFVPENAFCDGIMLDGTSIETLCEVFGVPVEIGSAHGDEFFRQLRRVSAEKTAKTRTYNEFN